MVSLSNKHCLLVSFLVVCFSFVNVASAAGNEKENPDDLTQSLHSLNDALVTFDQATLVAITSINSLNEGLDDLMSDSFSENSMPPAPVIKAFKASIDAKYDFPVARLDLSRWSDLGIKIYNRLEDGGDQLPDDEFYVDIQTVITHGQSGFNYSIEWIHNVITDLTDLQTNLTQINVQPKDITKDTDFVKTVSFVIQLAQEDSQVGRDLKAELQKIGPIPSETVKIDPVQKSKIIQAYLNVLKKTVDDSIQALSNLKVGQQSQLEAAPQAGQVSIGGEVNNGEGEGDAARKKVFEAFKQLEESMKVYKKHNGLFTQEDA